MSAPVAGIDSHQHNYTIGVADPNGVELEHQSFPATAAGYLAGIELLSRHGVHTVGIEGSASWGAHAAIAMVAAGFDCREVPPQRTAAQRRSRRSDKTDALDAVAVARAVLAEPTLGPVQTLETYDPLVAKIEAVLEHRRMLLDQRTLALHHVQDQLVKLPVEIRDQLDMTGKIEGRLRQLDRIDPTVVTTPSGEYRLSWLLPLIEQDRATQRQIRQLERDIETLLNEHGTTLREETGIGTINAATLLVEVGDPYRFARESKFARWCGTGAIALTTGEGDGPATKHRLDFGGNRRINSVLYIASITQHRHRHDTRAYIDRKLAEGKTRREARRAHKRHLANRVIRRMWRDESQRREPPNHLAA